MEGVQKQTRDYSCGAAAFNILLKNYFDENSYSEAALLTDIIFRLKEDEFKERLVDGFSMLDLKLLAQRLGYIGHGVMLPKESIAKLKGPVIILLHKRDNFKHFVVLKGAFETTAFIVDPLAGNYSIQLHDLFQQWNGEAFILEQPGFGLPQEHGLLFPKGNAASPQDPAVRALQNTKFSRKVMHSSFAR